MPFDLKKDKVYVVNYKTPDDEYIECYVLITDINDHKVTFYVTGVLSDDSKKSMDFHCKFNQELVWLKEDVFKIYWNLVLPETLKKKSRCPVCARMGKLVRTAMICEYDGVWGGF